jgi:hypothetical protein
MAQPDNLPGPLFPTDETLPCKELGDDIYEAFYLSAYLIDLEVKTQSDPKNYRTWIMHTIRVPSVGPLG